MIEVCNPITYLKKEEVVSKSFDLNGRKVAFLSNNKPNVNALFDQILKALPKQFKPRSVIRSAKANASHSAPAEILDKIAQEEAEVVINGVGD